MSAQLITSPPQTPSTNPLLFLGVPTKDPNTYDTIASIVFRYLFFINFWDVESLTSLVSRCFTIEKSLADIENGLDEETQKELGIFYQQKTQLAAYAILCMFPKSPHSLMTNPDLCQLYYREDTHVEFRVSFKYETNHYVIKVKRTLEYTHALKITKKVHLGNRKWFSKENWPEIQSNTATGLGRGFWIDRVKGGVKKSKHLKSRQVQVLKKIIKLQAPKNYPGILSVFETALKLNLENKPLDPHAIIRTTEALIQVQKLQAHETHEQNQKLLS